MPAIAISPGVPLSVDHLITDYTDPLAAAVATGLTVTAVLSDTPHGPAIDPGCVYAAAEVGAAPSGYSGTVYRYAIPGSSTLVPLASRVGRRVYLSPRVNGEPVERADVVELLVTA